jgi:hypothetical protein
MTLRHHTRCVDLEVAIPSQEISFPPLFLSSCPFHRALRSHPALRLLRHAYFLGLIEELLGSLWIQPLRHDFLLLAPKIPTRFLAADILNLTQYDASIPNERNEQSWKAVRGGLLRRSEGIGFK